MKDRKLFEDLAVILGVFKNQIEKQPYTELTQDFQDMILKCHDDFFNFMEKKKKENEANEESPWVQLFTAWTWTCPLCDAENVVKGVQCDDMTEEELQEARSQCGIEPWDEMNGYFVKAPTQSTCCQCDASFNLFQDEDEDEDELVGETT